MTDLPAALRARLAARVPFSSLELVRQAEARDGTVKALFHTHDGRSVEAVLMRYRDGRRSLCLSSDRKSTRLNSSHANISYAVFCLKKNNTTNRLYPTSHNNTRRTTHARSANHRDEHFHNVHTTG